MRAKSYPEDCALTSSLNPFQHVNSACRLSSSSRSSTTALIRLAVASRSRSTTLKNIEIKSRGPDSEDLYDLTADLIAGTAVVEVDVREQIRAKNVA